MKYLFLVVCVWDGPLPQCQSFEVATLSESRAFCELQGAAAQEVLLEQMKEAGVVGLVGYECMTRAMEAQR